MSSPHERAHTYTQPQPQPPTTSTHTQTPPPTLKPTHPPGRPSSSARILVVRKRPSFRQARGGRRPKRSARRCSILHRTWPRAWPPGASPARPVLSICWGGVGRRPWRSPLGGPCQLLSLPLPERGRRQEIGLPATRHTHLLWWQCSHNLAIMLSYQQSRTHAHGTSCSAGNRQTQRMAPYSRGCHQGCTALDRSGQRRISKLTVHCAMRTCHCRGGCCAGHPKTETDVVAGRQALTASL